MCKEDVDEVAAWIERTASHMDGPAEGDLAYFLDADLGVLARDAAGYGELGVRLIRHCHCLAFVKDGSPKKYHTQIHAKIKFYHHHQDHYR